MRLRLGSVVVRKDELIAVQLILLPNILQFKAGLKLFYYFGTSVEY